MIRRALEYCLNWWQYDLMIVQYQRAGFAYFDYTYLKNIGLSLSSPAWVHGQIARLPELRVVHFAEKAWTDHHDIFACVKDPGWQAEPPRISTVRYLKRMAREVMWRMGGPRENPRRRAVASPSESANGVGQARSGE